jgi:hypothetical protein
MNTPKNWKSIGGGIYGIVVGEPNYGEHDDRELVYAEVYQQLDDDDVDVYRWFYKMDRRDGPITDTDSSTSAMDASLDCEHAIATGLLAAPPSALIGLLRGNQSDVAARLGVAQSTISGWQRDYEMSRLARHLILAVLRFRFEPTDGRWWITG